jgi:hypothetical protein
LVGAADRRPVGDDEQKLRAAGLSTDDSSLLEYFRKQTPDPVAQTQIASLIRELGDRSSKVRDNASEQLVCLGMVAVSFLRQALQSSDLEVVRRAETCLRLIEDRDSRVGIPTAAARLLASRKTPGALQVLLGFLPFAENASVAEEVQSALVGLAVHDGKPDTALVTALGDKEPARRGAAAEALCRAGITEHRHLVRKLLEDPDEGVRLRAALALASAKEKEAVPVLIDLLGRLPQSRARQAEDLLLRLAGDQAPSTTVGPDETARRNCRAAWAAWWRDHQANVDFTKLEGAGRLLGYTLLVMLDAGRVLELGLDDRPRLQIDGLEYPLDAQVLPGDRLLVAEHHGDRVTERNRRGDIVWQFKVEQPLMAQRLPNGNTFIACTSLMLEVDRDGKKVFRRTPNGEHIMKAQRLPDGSIACITTGGAGNRFLRVDSAGRELASFPVNVNTLGGRIDVLPGNHVLVPERLNNRVVEYDATGKVAWEASFLQPVAAIRLPNGNTLVTSLNQNRAVELNRDGKQVWEYKSDTRVTRAFRR